MPGDIKVVLHDGNTTTEYTIAPDEQVALAVTREPTVTFDALYLQHALGYLNRMIAQKEAIGLKEASELQEHLRVHSYLFASYRYFEVERYATIRELVASEEKTATPNTQTVWARFQKNPHMLKIEAAARFREKAYHDHLNALRKKNATQSYDFDFLKEFNLDTLFSQLNITPDQNHQAPEDYLLKSMGSTADQALMHVRQCEDMMCSLHHRHPEAQQATRTLDSEISRFAKNALFRDGNKQKRVYVGFASGLLRRDMQHLQSLISAGMTNLSVIFIDPLYGKYISQMQYEPCDVSINEQIEIDMLNKGIYELAAHLGNQLDDPSELHFFSSADQALAYLDAKALKIDLLTAEDIFLDDGATCQEVATLGAHRDFMKLKNQALAVKGQFCELIKDDNHAKLYYHGGGLMQNITTVFSKLHPPKQFANREITECSDAPSYSPSFRF